MSDVEGAPAELRVHPVTPHLICAGAADAIEFYKHAHGWSNRLVAGDSDREAMDFIVDRYGEYVLLNPRATGANWLLWGAGPLMLLLAGGLGAVYLRGRARGKATNEAPLTPEEEARLRDILDR